MQWWTVESVCIFNWDAGIHEPLNNGTKEPWFWTFFGLGSRKYKNGQNTEGLNERFDNLWSEYGQISELKFQHFAPPSGWI